jgi:hypothetical protein
MKDVIICLCVIVAIFLLYSLFVNIKNAHCKSKYNMSCDQKHVEKLYTELPAVVKAGDTRVNDLLRDVASMKNPRPIDNFRAGVVELIHKKNNDAASRHFGQAIAAATKAPNQENLFVLERIEDFGDVVSPEFGGEEIFVQDAIISHYNTELKKAAATPPTERSIERKIHWVSDSQNVHDECIRLQLINQLAIVERDNSISQLILTFEDCESWAINRATRENQHTLIKNLFDIMRISGEISYIPNKSEYLIIEALWRRIHDPRNDPRQSQLKQSLYTSLLECYEGGFAVCLTGRICKIWGSLAHLDFNEEIGILRGKQAVRNEIYEKCAAIRRKEFASADKQTVDDYTNSRDTELVKQLVIKIKDEMDNIKNDYKGLVNENTLNLILEDCKAAI